MTVIHQLFMNNIKKEIFYCLALKNVWSVFTISLSPEERFVSDSAWLSTSRSFFSVFLC